MEETPATNEIQNELQELTKKQRRALKKQQQHEERQQTRRSQSAKTWLAWTAVIAIIGLGLWWLVASSQTSGLVAIPPQTEITETDHTKGGDGNAVVRIIEYSDFQCPACAAYYPIISQLVDEFGDAIQFAYRHFPLTAIHPNAEEAGRASEAAAMQGNFWGMHDMLFERQSEWSPARNPFDLFAGYAEAIGLDAAQFEADYNSDAAKDTVAAHETAGRRLGVGGTPTFVVNGEQITNPAGYEAFRSLVISLGAAPQAAQEQTDATDTATTTEENL